MEAFQSKSEERRRLRVRTRGVLKEKVTTLGCGDAIDPGEGADARLADGGGAAIVFCLALLGYKIRKSVWSEKKNQGRQSSRCPIAHFHICTMCNPSSKHKDVRRVEATQRTSNRSVNNNNRIKLLSTPNDKPNNLNNNNKQPQHQQHQPPTSSSSSQYAHLEFSTCRIS